MAKRQRGTSSSSATENDSSIKSLCFNEPGRQNLQSWELVRTEWKRKGKAAADNVDDVLQDVDDPVNLIRNEHITDAADNWTEADLLPHFHVMLDSFEVRLATMQSHFDGRLNEISNQQSEIQTELFEIRGHLNDKFDRLFVVVGNRSHDLSTSKAPIEQ
ncbi:hypothetical protein V6N13_051098 [Hibiscus sabdariffa]|uniref:Uncharacterized protein n=1 Tax=Hibiscus sabdariffa TaxID=183260 RepID=A0ABR2T2K0_9ROSI